MSIFTSLKHIMNGNINDIVSVNHVAQDNKTIHNHSIKDVHTAVQYIFDTNDYLDDYSCIVNRYKVTNSAKSLFPILNSEIMIQYLKDYHVVVIECESIDAYYYVSTNTISTTIYTGIELNELFMDIYTQSMNSYKEIAHTNLKHIERWLLSFNLDDSLFRFVVNDVGTIDLYTTKNVICRYRDYVTYSRASIIPKLTLVKRYNYYHNPLSRVASTDNDIGSNMFHILRNHMILTSDSNMHNLSMISAIVSSNSTITRSIDTIMNTIGLSQFKDAFGDVLRGVSDFNFPLVLINNKHHNGYALFQDGSYVTFDIAPTQNQLIINKHESYVECIIDNIVMHNIFESDQLDVYEIVTT